MAKARISFVEQIGSARTHKTIDYSLLMYKDLNVLLELWLYIIIGISSRIRFARRQDEQDLNLLSIWRSEMIGNENGKKIRDKSLGAAASSIKLI